MTAQAFSRTSAYLPPSLHHVAEALRAAPTRAVVLLGPGGAGKTTLLGHLSQRWAAGSTAVVRGAEPGRPRGASVRVVDDAHLLDAASAARLADEARAELALVLAARPDPDRPGLDALLGALPDPLLIDVGPWSAADAADWWAHAGGHGRPAPGPAWVVTAPGPSALTERCRHLLSGLDADDQAVAALVAAGADLARHDPTGQRRDVLEAAGLVGCDGRMPPGAAAALLASLPPHRLRQLARRALVDLDAAACDATLEALAATGVRDPRLAEALLTRGDDALAEHPAEADAWYRLAAGAGAERERYGVRRAEAALRTGDLAEALPQVEALLAAEPPLDPAAVLPLALNVFVRRGMADRAAELCRWHAPALRGVPASLAALVLLASGDRAGARALVDQPPVASPTFATAAAGLLVEGLSQSLGAAPGHGVATLIRGAESAAAARLPVLPDCPAVIAGLAALHAGDTDVAAGVLGRQLEGCAPYLRARLLLVRGWVEMARGDLAAAEQARGDTARLGPLDTRDAFWSAALEAGLARRSEDPHRLRAAWAEARECLLRQPMDLFTLLPLAELWLVAVRLHADAAVAGPLAAAWDVLHRLGDPVLWSTPLHWAGVQAAILANRPPDVGPHAQALVAAASAHAPAATLAAAGRTWLRVLAGDVDLDAALAASADLDRLGHGWEGRRLLGHAAARCDDRRVAAVLLDAARRLAEPPAEGPTAGPGRPADQPRLSGREVEVARLLLLGRTYREVGETLYLSARTVEHHVARVKRRLGAETRSDLLEMLRGVLADQA